MADGGGDGNGKGGKRVAVENVLAGGRLGDVGVVGATRITGKGDLGLADLFGANNKVDVVALAKKAFGSLAAGAGKAESLGGAGGGRF